MIEGVYAFSPPNKGAKKHFRHPSDLFRNQPSGTESTLSSHFGQLFRITTFGESHGGALGVVIDGCPPRLPLSIEEIQADLDRRRPGQSQLTTQRKETDQASIASGLFEGQTLGTPIAVWIPNRDAKSSDYEAMKDLYRPSHADYTYEARYGIRNWQGGGRASARETVARVAAGAVARKLLRHQFQVEVLGWVQSIAQITASIDPTSVTSDQVESSPVRCPDADAAQPMIEQIQSARKDGDSVGGTITVVARGVPAGWGEPVFDKLEADLAKALLSIPAAKGFEIGSGFEGSNSTGSQHNDLFHSHDGQIRTLTNRSGGVQGGISNGEDIQIRVAFKPTATIARRQSTVDRDGKTAKIEGHGRHDPCVLPRAVPICEAMVLLVLADHALRTRGQMGSLDETH
jgi:chorismate synthase